MGKIRFGIIAFLAFLLAAALLLQPVMAANNSVSIAYRGSGGNYIGDTIIFDGYDHASNVTVLKVSGPGLPAGGVPVYDLNGKEGAGNPVEVNPDGSWRFAWYTNQIKGLDHMQTARYYITATDFGDPSQSATTSVMMKKPDFYITPSPDRLESGDYVLMVGNAEQGVTDIRIQITDASGKVWHTYDTAASGSGYISYSLHTDMPVGDYIVTMTSPSTGKSYRTTLTIIPPGITANVTPSGTAAVPTTVPVSPPGQPATAPGTSTIAVSSTPSDASVYIDSNPAGNTPVTVPNIQPGTHTVEIRKAGYLPFSAQVTVKAGEQATVSPSLVKNPLAVPLPVTVAIVGLVLAIGLFAAFSARRKQE